MHVGIPKEKKKSDPARIRTWNPLIRSQMPYPLGHRALLERGGKSMCVHEFTVGAYTPLQM